MAAGDVTEDGTIGEGGDETPFVHRYDSPFLSTENVEGDAALILLNTPISAPQGSSSTSSSTALRGVLGALWDASSYRVCADGAANRLYDATVGSASTNGVAQAETNEAILDASNQLYLPDMITGDLDSLLPHVREYYEDRGVPVVRVEDQDQHDLDKSLAAVERWMASEALLSTEASHSRRVFVYGAFGGRFDQEMGCINALYRWGPKFRHRLAMYGEETCAFVLPGAPATNEIRIRFPDGEDSAAATGEDDNSTSNGRRRRKLAFSDVGEGPTCGLIPMGAKCEDVRTTGLKWNLDGDFPLEFGGLVSSSNRITEEVATIQSSQSMVFTTEIIAK